MRNKCKFSRPVPPRGQFLNQRSHRDDRLDYDHENHERFGKMHERSSRGTPYDRFDRESRYTSSSNEYQSSEHEHSDSHYDVNQHEESSSRRHGERYRSPPRALLVTSSVPASAIYTTPVPAVPPIHPPIILPPAPKKFVPQHPPPGASPINTAKIPSQPSPPGVGPPLLPLSSEAPPAFGRRPFDMEDPLKDSQKAERSKNDRIEEFQRKLKRDRIEYLRDMSPRSRRRSSDRHRSRSPSRSWSRPETRSSTRTSRFRTPFSSRSRTRSFSPSRCRSWSKKRFYSRSQTRTRSRSRSRSRNDSRARRRGGSRDSRQWSPRSRGRSNSISPKSYRNSSRRNEDYSLKHPYNPPHYRTLSSYQSQYGPPIIPMTVMQPPDFPPHHMHTLHSPPIQPIHYRPIDPYPPVERSMKYPPSYGGQYPVYSQKYQQPKYDREQRFGDHSGGRYDRRSEYPRNEEEVHPRIPGWVGDRSRDSKPRYRQSRDLRGKDIEEFKFIIIVKAEKA